jgi:isopentenyl-diphosphate delta-isomerase
MTKQKREKEQVVLVDQDGVVRELDGEILTLDRGSAHRRGVLHRAVSVFVFNTRGELLLQKRGRQKSHSGGLWTNTCCTHPRKGENPIVAARRRLAEEMGLKCELNEVWSFLYWCRVGNRLVEHEYDHVFLGSSDHDPSPNADEVADWAWIGADDLGRDLRENPGRFTPWFRISYHEVLKSRWPPDSQASKHTDTLPNT